MVLVGLGNNEKRYVKTRHNVGFRIVDRLASELGLAWKNHKLFETAVGEYEGQKVELAKSRLLMNNSGEAVKQLLLAENQSVTDLILIYDDLNVSLGTVRVRAEGSHGGHNGVRSVIDQLGSGQFWRVRVGIGPAGHTDNGRVELDSSDYTDFVLSKFTTSEEHKLQEVIDLLVPRMLAFIGHKEELKDETFSL